MAKTSALKILLLGIAAFLSRPSPLTAQPTPSSTASSAPQTQAPASGEMSPKDFKLLLIVLGGLGGFVLLVVLLGGEMTISSRGRVVYHRKFSGKYADLTLSLLQVLLAGIGLGGKTGYRGGGGKFGGGGASGSW